MCKIISSRYSSTHIDRQREASLHHTIQASVLLVDGVRATPHADLQHQFIAPRMYSSIFRFANTLVGILNADNGELSILKKKGLVKTVILFVSAPCSILHNFTIEERNPLNSIVVTLMPNKD